MNDGSGATVSVAVDADSLATWLLPALRDVRGQLLLRLTRADQDLTAALPRDGTVSAAVTTAAQPVPGCTSTPLGAMRYRPCATAELVADHVADGVSADALRRAPVVHFDRDLSGFGWGMLSDLQLARLPAGAVQLLDPRAVVDVPLDWQRSLSGRRAPRATTPARRAPRRTRRWSRASRS